MADTGYTHQSAVFVTCDLCYRSHGAIVDKDDPKSVKAGYVTAGLKALRCTHTEEIA